MLPPLTKSTNIKSYFKRFDNFVKCNKTEADIQKATLLTVIGEDGYELLETLCHPTDPSDMTLEQLKEELIKHLAPEPSVAASRYCFQQCRQSEGQAFVDFLAELRKAAAHCKFNVIPANPLNDRLRDQIIFGLRDEKVRSKLLGVKELTYEQAVEIVKTSDSSKAEAKEMEISKQVSKVRSFEATKRPRWPCYRCNGTGHYHQDCRFKEAICDACKKKGHIKAACRSLRNRPGVERPDEGKEFKKATKKTGKVKKAGEDSNEDNSNDEDGDIYWLKKVDKVLKSPRDTIMLTCVLDGTPVTMELDTGCGLSLAPMDFYNRYLRHLPLQRCTRSLRTYSNEKIEVLGQVHVNVHHNQQTKNLALIIVSNGAGALFGRNWL